MATKLIIPEKYLEEIKAEGMRESGKRRNFPRPGKEARGRLFGYYDEQRNLILVNEKYTVCSLIGDGTEKSNNKDLFTDLLNSPKIIYVCLKELLYIERMKQKGTIPAIIYYHSHPQGNILRNGNSYLIQKFPWSKKDICVAREFQKHYKKSEVMYAMLLYKVFENEFEALYGETKLEVQSLGRETSR